MSDIRRSLISETPVIVATDRAMRPDDFAKKVDVEAKLEKPCHDPKCPFCTGNEDMVPPPEIIRLGEPGQKWTLRVVPNKYPAATPEERSAFVIQDAGSSVITNAFGAHEVIIETAVHNEEISAMPVWKLLNVLQVADDRFSALYSHERIRYVQLFKNFGSEAGASLEHPHWQIIALPDVPEKINHRLFRCREYQQQHNRDIFQDAINQADQHKLVVRHSGNFLCYCPYASKVPFEMTILPLKSTARLTDNRAQFQELATMMSMSFKALDKVLKYLPPFNMFLEEAPPNVYCKPEEFFRWRLRIIPRITKVAGFEFSTGYYINPLPPERAAEALRKAVMEMEPLPATLKRATV